MIGVAQWGAEIDRIIEHSLVSWCERWCSAVASVVLNVLLSREYVGQPKCLSLKNV
jgi:hypothetical protein